jgi:uncharacterized protein YgiM (DUF1202 family)
VSDAPSRWVAPTRIPPPRNARWREVVSASLLLLAVAIVAVTASPVLFRAAGLTRTATTARGVDSRRDPQTALGADERATRRPSFPVDDDDDELSPHDDLQRLYPEEGNWPGKRARDQERGQRGSGAADAPGSPSSSLRKELRVGLAEKPLQLRERPTEGSEVTGAVPQGEMVMILKESDGWVLVVHDGSTAGWTRRSEIAVR